MFGRRPDGKRVKGIDPIIRITPYLMPMRCDAQVFLKHRIDMEVLFDYIRRQKLEKGEQLSYMQLICAAYVRAIARNPLVNCFIVNKQILARNNCSVAFTILKDPNNIDAGEAVANVKFDLTDTVYDVRDRINAAVEANRGAEADSGFVSKLLNFVFSVPGLATVIVALIRFLDRYGIAPRVFMDELPFYVGMYITNTASIRLHDVNHHLYNWGNVGLFFGMGIEERVAVVENGETRMKRFLPLGITADERVCSGAHYAKFFNDMRRFLEHPEVLETPPESVQFDEGNEYHLPKVQKQ